MNNPEKIFKSQWMWKKNHQTKVNKGWRKRWFVLRQERLAYYKNEKEYEMLHYIPLNLIYSITEASNSRRPHVLCVTVLQPKTVDQTSAGKEAIHLHHHQRRATEATVYFLDAGSRAELEEWMAAFKDALRNISNITFLCWDRDFRLLSGKEAPKPEDESSLPEIVISPNSLGRYNSNEIADIQVPEPVPVTPEISVKIIPNKMAIYVFLKTDIQDLKWWKAAMDEVFTEWRRIVTSGPSSAITREDSDNATKLSDIKEEDSMEGKSIVSPPKQPTENSDEGQQNIAPSPLALGRTVKPIDIPNKLELNTALSTPAPFSSNSFLTSPFHTPLTEAVSQLSGFLLKMRHGKSLKRKEEGSLSNLAQPKYYKYKSKDWQRRWCVLRGTSLMWYSDQREYEVLNLVRFSEVLVILPHREGFPIDPKNLQLKQSGRRSSIESGSSKASTIGRAKNVVMRLIGKRGKKVEGHSPVSQRFYYDSEEFESEEDSAEEEDEYDSEEDDPKNAVNVEIATPKAIPDDCKCIWCDYVHQWAEKLPKDEHENCCYTKHAPLPHQVPIVLFHALLTTYHQEAQSYIEENFQRTDGAHPNATLPPKFLDQVWDNFWKRVGLEGVSMPTEVQPTEFSVWHHHEEEEEQPAPVTERDAYSADESDHRLYPIQLVTAKKSYYFACYQQEEMEHWVVALRKAYLSAHITGQEFPNA